MTTTDGRPLSALEVAAWRGVLAARFAVVRELGERLSQEHRLSASAFDVLQTLAAASRRETAMARLAERVLMSPSGLTRVVARLERDGLVARRRDPRDARVWLVGLTRAGRARLVRAERTYHGIVRARFADRLSRERLGQLAEAWTELRERG